jgi:hypothetical protein
VTLVEEQTQLMRLASANLRSIPWGVAFRLANAAFDQALPGDEPMSERIDRAFRASNAVWREALAKHGISTTLEGAAA